MFRDLISISAKVFLSGCSCRYVVAFTLLIAIHEVLYLNDTLVSLYIALSALFIISAFYADKQLLYQVKEGFMICGAKRVQLRVVLYLYAILLSFSVATPQIIVFIYRGLEIYGIVLLLVVVILVSLIYKEISVRLNL